MVRPIWVQFFQIDHKGGYRSLNSLDIFTVVETFIHSPLPGLELEALHSYVVNEPVQRISSPDRVKAVREVVDWIARSV